MNFSASAWLCVLLFLISAVLFLITGIRRRKIDAVLKHAAARNGGVSPPQLGPFRIWPSPAHFALAPPERRWTYNQDYMIAFIEALSPAATLAATQSRRPVLGYYARSVLTLDRVFAVVFAAFIVATGFVLAVSFGQLFDGWFARTCIVSACLGVIYGVADLAEDTKLRSIFIHAERLAVAKKAEKLPPGAALADAAEVDAASALTRIKLVTIAASVTGLAFLILLGLDRLVAAVSGGPSDGAAVGADDFEVRPALEI